MTLASRAGIVTAAVAAVLALVGAGCGGGDDAAQQTVTATRQDGAASVPTATAAEGTAAQAGQEYLARVAPLNGRIGQVNDRARRAVAFARRPSKLP